MGMNKNKFYTLTGYNIKEKKKITSAMEDYLEMIYRLYKENKNINIKNISNKLNVKYSSTTKMINRLEKEGFVNYEKYKEITITKKGLSYGRYLLKRHEILVNFFKYINKDHYNLEQVEKIEHFTDKITIKNIESLLNKIKDSSN